MCGIFGYIGHREKSIPLVIKGLKKLEYRGYDSWGIASYIDGSLFLQKQVGKISEVKLADFNDQKSSLSIGHTRWATHGGVTKKNAHPHADPEKRVVVVHNGIIENYESIRDHFGKENFVSETDTEVIAHLIGSFRTAHNFQESVLRAVRLLEGRYSIVVIDRDTNQLIAARRGSPLIVGVGKGEYFLASDIPAFLEYTQEVMYLDDEEMVVIDGDALSQKLQGELKFFNIKTGELILKRLVNIDWQAESAEKGDYDHFMLKEIMEQKDTILRAINQDEKEIMKIAKAIKESRGCFLSGCGTAGKVCMAAEYFFSMIASRHVNFSPASEFPIYHHFLRPESLLIVVSQSGETADVLEAMKVAKSKGSKVLSLVNVQGSTIARQSDYSLQINAGPEKAVASTKAATSQLALLLLITYAMIDQLQEGRRVLAETASKVNDMLNAFSELH
ncbi:glutamine--fructose-6-phosphate transaminase (isomerizing) [Candidatus Peregrinibacteria bacterium]|nr:MAG: glutamine--fructose-6-phosphate transaminase (isomerizing) [Candidatus Peregrinibacteria bacterium]